MTDSVQLRQTYPAPKSPTALESPQVGQERLLDGDTGRDGLPGPSFSPASIKESRPGDMLYYNITFVGLLTFLLASWYLAITTAMLAPKREWFPWHPSYQSLGIAFMVMGIQTLQPTATPASKKLGLSRHQVLQIACLLSITAGTSAIVLNKISHSAPHLISWHAYFGLVAYVGLIFQSAFGAASVWWKGRAFGGELKAKRMWKWHRISGYLLLLWMLLTALLAGEWSGWARTYASPMYRGVGFGLSLLLVGVGVSGRMRLGKMRWW